MTVNELECPTPKLKKDNDEYNEKNNKVKSELEKKN